MSRGKEYHRNHARVYRKRGPAGAQACVACGSSAQQWAQLHGTTGENPHEDYQPMCKDCHNTYDLPVKGAKISAALMGHEVTDAAREKISAAHAGVKQSPEHVAKRAAALRGKPRAPFSEEHRARLRAAWERRRKAGEQK